MAKQQRYRGGLRLVCLAWVWIAFAAILAVGAEPPATPLPPAVAVSNIRGATVDLTAEKQAVVCQVMSESGIGSLQISRSKDWPSTLILRLQLKGLESLTLTAGKQRMSMCVSSSSPARLNVSLGEDEKPVAAESPYFPGFRVLDAEFRPAKQGQLPPPGGWFEINVPQKLLQDQKQLQVNFIDFFRG